MVEIPSLSRQEHNLARFLRDQMEARGFAARIDEAGNAVGAIGDSRSGPTVLLLGHMDTVPGDVPIRQEGDLLYGRGTVDAKGPLATFIAAATGFSGPGRLVVVGAVEEEAATSRGARHIIESYQPDAALVGEPSAWDRVTIGYKGRLLATYEVRQQTAHTAADRQGACGAAISFWQRVAATADAFNADRPETAFERLQYSLRAMRSANDGLEETAVLEIGFRLPVGFDVAAWQETLTGLVDEGSLQFYAYEPAVRVDKNTGLARSMLAAIRQEGGIPRYTVKTGTSDLNVIATRWRCPMLAYGPGDAALDHTPHEHIKLDEYLRAIRVLRHALGTIAVSLAPVAPVSARS